jgi:hypothetical protein
LVVFLATFAISLPVLGSHTDTFAPGELFVSSTSGITTFVGHVSWCRHDGSVNELVFSDTAGGMAFDATGRLLVGRAHDIVVILPTQQLGGTFADDLSHKVPNAIVADRAGNVYVATPAPSQLRRYSADGALLHTYDLSLPAFADLIGIDLGADQCTMIVLLRSGTRVPRYDVCRDTALSDFATLGASGNFGGLRILPDQEVLISKGDLVYRLAANGTVLRTYGVPGATTLTRLALAPDAMAFWVIPTGLPPISLISLDTGSVIETRTPKPTANDLIVSGEPRAAATGGAAIPTLSLSALGLLVLVVAVVAFLRL